MCLVYRLAPRKMNNNASLYGLEHSWRWIRFPPCASLRACDWLPNLWASLYGHDIWSCIGRKVYLSVEETTAEAELLHLFSNRSPNWHGQLQHQDCGIRIFSGRGMPTAQDLAAGGRRLKMKQRIYGNILFYVKGGGSLALQSVLISKNRHRTDIQRSIPCVDCRRSGLKGYSSRLKEDTHICLTCAFHRVWMSFARSSTEWGSSCCASFPCSSQLCTSKSAEYNSRRAVHVFSMPSVHYSTSFCARFILSHHVLNFQTKRISSVNPTQTAKQKEYYKYR